MSNVPGRGRRFVGPGACSHFRIFGGGRGGLTPVMCSVCISFIAVLHSLGLRSKSPFGCNDTRFNWSNGLSILRGFERGRVLVDRGRNLMGLGSGRVSTGLRPVPAF